MKLRTKSILFFGFFLIGVVSAVVLYVQYVVGGTFNDKTVKDLRIFSEQSASAYRTFLKSLQGVSINWSSDSYLQNIIAKLLKAEDGTPEKTRIEKEFANFIIENKMPYNKTVFLVDVLDKNGLVIASTRPERIGVNENEEKNHHEVSDFTKAINSNFGEAFVGNLAFEKDENTEPVIHSMVRIFIPDGKGEHVPLDAVLMVHFLSVNEIVDVLGARLQGETDTGAGSALLENYNTSEVYLVDNKYTMITPSRFVNNVNKQQKVDTLPVRECFENNKGITAIYDDYRGIPIMGSAVCFKNEGLVLLVEIDKDEILLPTTTLARGTFFGGIALIFFGFLIIALFVRLPLKRLDEVVDAEERVMKGDFNTQIVVHVKDEIGRLAEMFNSMVKTIRDTQKDLQKSNDAIKEKAVLLEKEIEEHKRQEKLLENSRTAILNILEDSEKTKEDLRVESVRLETVVSSVGDGLIIVDRQYVIRTLNPKAVEFLATPYEELIGKDLRTAMSLVKNKKGELPLTEWPTEEMFLTKKVVVVSLDDEIALTNDNRKNPLPVTLSIAPLGKDATGGVIVVRDATEDRALDEAKSGFISVASHQLRTPLTTIRWYSEMLLGGDAGKLSDAQRDFLEEIHGGADRLYQTIDLLLGISRIESGKTKSEPTSVNLSLITEEVVHEITPQLQEKKLLIKIIPPEAEIIINVDVLTFRQVILNLFSNAINYTNEGGVIEVRFEKSREGEEVVYSVCDNGIGIPENERNHIFSKFFRAENASAKRPDGSGLGLSLVKEIVESWGGKVWFESVEGRGTTFFFTIPLIK